MMNDLAFEDLCVCVCVCVCVCICARIVFPTPSVLASKPPPAI